MLRLAICALFLAASPPRFEVAAIHPTDPRDWNTPSGCHNDPGLLRCNNVTLKRCITGAYAIGPDRVLGGPTWIDTDRFQITARASEPADDRAMMAMLGTLLAESFHLTMHHEQRSTETLVLGISTRGPMLQPAAPTDSHSWKNMHDHVEATKIPVSELAAILSRNLNLPVVDQTGLTGEFTFTLTWNPRDADAAPHDEALAILRPEIAAAITRELGLTAKFRKMPADYLMIDHAEQPTAQGSER